MAEKKDITKLSKVELVEMLQRQEKLLLNRKFMNSLPDKGEKIHKLVKRLREQIAIREQANDLTNRFKRISLAQRRNARQDDDIDSDDDDDDAMNADGKESSLAANQIAAPEGLPSSKGKSPNMQLSGKWAYDSAVTYVKPHVFEKAKVLSFEESRELQLKQDEQYKALKAKQAADKLFEHINRSSSQTNPTSYEFSSMEAKMKYRLREEENVQENEEDDSESEDKLYGEQEQSDVED